jgi:hypothetical protein
VDDHRFDRVRGELARKAGHLDISEAVEGERGLEHVVAATQDEPVGRLRRSQRSHAELAVLEDLGVPDHDLIAGLSASAHTQPANEVLPEVHKRPSAGRGPDADGSARLVAHDRWTDVGHEQSRVEVEQVHRDAWPTLRRASGIDGLAVVQIVRDGPRRRRSPVGSGREELPVTVGEGDLELCDEPAALAVGVLAEPSESAAPPTRTDRGGQLVVGSNPGGDVVGPVAESPLVARPAGAQDVVADRFTVQGRLEHPETGGVECGVGDVTVTILEVEANREAGCAVDLCGCGDHPRLPSAGGGVR